MPLTKNAYIFILLLEFIVYLPFIFHHLTLSDRSETIPNLDYKSDESLNKYLGYFNVEQIIRNHTSGLSSFILLGFIYLIIITNFIFLASINYYASDDYKLLFLKSSMKSLIKITGNLQILLFKALLIPIYIIILSHLACNNENTGL